MIINWIAIAVCVACMVVMIGLLARGGPKVIWSLLAVEALVLGVNIAVVALGGL